MNFRRRATPPVCYYALLGRWLLSSQHPGRLRRPTSFCSLSPHLGALAGGLGCFPLGNGAYPPSPHSRVSGDGIRSLVGFGCRVWSLAPSSALPPSPCARGCTDMHFGENQLSPRSIGISPLPTAHPMVLHHQRVRASTRCYPRFTLAMGRSRGFGSTAADYALFRLAFAAAAASRP